MCKLLSLISLIPHVSYALLQAGLLCGVSDFNAYVWEEQVSVLGLESFYFGKIQSFEYLIKYFLSAFGVLGIGISGGTVVLLVEKIFHKITK